MEPENQSPPGGDRQVPPIPAPFTGQPRELGNRSGCGRIALIGCGLAMLLLGVVAVVAVLRVHHILAWSLSVLETQVEARLPDDLPGEARVRLGQAFDAARAAIRRGEVDPIALERLQQQMMRLAPTTDQPLSQAEVETLSEVLEQVAGGPPEGRPAPSPDASPTNPDGADPGDSAIGPAVA